ncbi:hypothetical protein LTR85_008531 [Meristemomyces frigidus]|nr:hypothetical protein LTR85_008531 [Meristemomyces frigidus]
MAIRNSITEIKVFVATHIRSVSINELSPPDGNLRPCQEHYIGGGRAKRRFKRDMTSPTSPSVEPIFAEHEVNMKRVDSAMPSPTSTSSWTWTTKKGSSGLDRTYNNTCRSGGAAEERARAAIEQEKWVLLNSINSARKLEGALSVILDQALSNDLQGYADISEDSDMLQPIRSPGQVTTMRATTITASTSSRGTRSVLLVSPPGLGGLACGELWYGGKYKHHAYSAPSEDRVHPEDCPCHGGKVFDTMVDGMWKTVGIARFLKDGR